MTSRRPPPLPEDSDGVTDDADHYATWDAAYVLGALTPAERRDYESHLSRCGACRRAVTEICGIPALLSRLDMATAVDALNGGDETSICADRSTAKRDVLTAAARVRRRRRGWAAMVMALVVTATIVVIAVREYRGVSSAPVAVPMRAVEPSALTSSVTLSAQQWGTRIDVRSVLTDTPHISEHHDDEAGDAVAVVLINDQGVTVRAAAWTLLADQVAVPSTDTSWPLETILTVQVIGVDGHVLLESDR